MAARHAATASLGRSVQQFRLIVGTQPLQVRGHLLRTQFAHQPALLVQQAGFGAEQQQFVGGQIDGCAGSDVFAGQIENLARR